MKAAKKNKAKVPPDIALQIVKRFAAVIGKRTPAETIIKLLDDIGKLPVSNIPFITQIKRKLSKAVTSIKRKQLEFVSIEINDNELLAQIKAISARPRLSNFEKLAVSLFKQHRPKNTDVIVVPPRKPGVVSVHSILNGVGDSLFTPMDQVKPQQDTFRLKGDLGKLLGDLELYQLAITIEGDQGAGKTQFAFQLADGFAGIGKSVGFFSLEAGKSSNLVTSNRDRYIAPANRERVQIAGSAPDGIKTVRDYATKFQVVIIDSWSKLGADSSEFDRLRKDFPQTIWIVLFQRTTSGQIRGGTKPLFDAGINLEAVKVDDSFINNYIVSTKNRYGATGIKYNIAGRKIMAPVLETKEEKEDSHV